MKMKTLIVVMAVCLCLSILYGCGSNTESGNAGIRIRCVTANREIHSIKGVRRLLVLFLKF